MAEKNTPNRTYSEKCSVMTPKWIAAAPRERAARATGSVRAEAAVHQVRKSIVLIHPDYEPVEHLVLALRPQGTRDEACCAAPRMCLTHYLLGREANHDRRFCC